MQQVMKVKTDGNDVSSKIVFRGDISDPSLAQGDPSKETPTVKAPEYPTVLHAMRDGWEILGPPEKHTGRMFQDTYEWLLVRRTHTEIRIALDRAIEEIRRQINTSAPVMLDDLDVLLCTLRNNL